MAVPMITAIVEGDALEASSAAPVPWWSVTKTVLAAAALVLVARGALALDEPVAGRPFTLRQLLAHRSGLRDYGTVDAYHAAVAAGGPPWPVEAMLRHARATSPLFRPGEGFAYSNIGYLRVRRLIEQAADAPLADALATLVLAPLGLAGTTIAEGAADLEATAWGNARGYDPGWVYHGLLVGPAGEAALFLHRLLAGGLLPPALLEAMHDGWALPPAPSAGRPWVAVRYGLGLSECRTLSDRFVGHSGAGPGSSAAVLQHVSAAGSRRIAAAFAPVDEPGAAEIAAVRLAARSGVRR